MSRASRSVITVVAALSLLFAGSTTAQANDVAKCKVFYARLFTHLSYDRLGRSMEYNVRAIAWPHDDQATSLMTRANDCNSRYYEHPDYVGRSIDFGRPSLSHTISSDPDLRNGGGGGNYKAENWNDRISSVKSMNCA